MMNIYTTVPFLDGQIIVWFRHQAGGNTWTAHECFSNYLATYSS